MIQGVYQIQVHHFADVYPYTLHIKQEGAKIFAQIKHKDRACSFYNGSTIISPAEDETHQFLFRSAQVEDYVNVLLPNGQRVNLSPPGGYHVNGMLFGGTVIGDELNGAIIIKDMMVISMRGQRIPGQPEIQMEIRTDYIPGKNPYCTCGTGTCTHRGYCDCCQVFEFMHCAGMPDMPSPAPQVPVCMSANVNSLFGITKEDLAKMMPPPEDEPDDGRPEKSFTVNGEKRPAHGKHHYIDPNYVYNI